MAESALLDDMWVGQQLLFRSSVLRSNVMLGYGVGVAAFVFALVLRFWLDGTLPPGFPFLTFIPAVIISAFLAGWRAATFCATLSFLSAWYWFIAVLNPFAITYGAAVALGFFTLISSVSISIIEMASTTVDRLIAREEQLNKTQIDLGKALQGKEVLLYEVNHRVKNSLQLVSSFLLLEASKISNSEARSAVIIARNKVDMVARLHQLLYAGGTHDHVNLKSALEDIVRHLVLSAGREDVHLEFSFSGDLMMNIRHASPLVLAVNEIVTNSLKYGLGSGEPKLTVTASNRGNEMTLVMGDNGPGIAATTPEKKPGTGRQIVEGLLSQIRGTLFIQIDGSGTTNTLKIPLNLKSFDRNGATE